MLSIIRQLQVLCPCPPAISASQSMKTRTCKRYPLWHSAVLGQTGLNIFELGKGWILARKLVFCILSFVLMLQSKVEDGLTELSAIDFRFYHSRWYKVPSLAPPNYMADQSTWMYEFFRNLNYSSNSRPGASETLVDVQHTYHRPSLCNHQSDQVSSRQFVLGEGTSQREVQVGRVSCPSSMPCGSPSTQSGQSDGVSAEPSGQNPAQDMQQFNPKIST